MLFLSRPFSFYMVPAVAFDGVFADVDEFANDKEREEWGEVSMKGGLAHQAADGR